MDPKKLAALEAVKLIEPDTKVGLGAGSTIAHLTDFLAKKIEEGLRVEIFTSSDETAARLSAKGIPVSDIGRVTRLHVYLDGCDQFDRRLNALKSGGGIHTSEKLFASMADAFILIGDHSKCVENLESER